MAARRVLVTGGSRGLGRAIADVLTERGWQVAAPTRTELDLAEPDSVAAYLAALGEPDFDAAVLNAGINDPSPLEALTDEAWRAVLEVNLTSAFTLTKALAPAMARRGGGALVATSSVYAARARIGRSVYSASKAALSAFISTVAVEYGAQGVRANCIAPGFVDTELTRKNNDATAIATLLERVPMGRLAQPQEIGNSVAFLLSEDASFITGQTLFVDGGFTCT
ncbi:MAG TPA: SDR family NAD(P)-dependent oxidoreductase [Jatrophihabitans sp.]